MTDDDDAFTRHGYKARHEQQEQRADLLAEMRNGSWLDRQTFPPLQWAVPGILSEGFGLLVAPPKKGKSWLAADIGLACAAGGKALGTLTVDKRAVLYLALEDGYRRLQVRFRRVMGRGTAIPVRMHIITEAARHEIPGMIEQFLCENAHYSIIALAPPLVILDTLGRAKTPRPPGVDAYQHDYDFGVRLKKLIDALPGATLVAVHHTRKMQTGDFVDSVSGTNAVAGAADFVVMLDRKRHSDDAVLNVTGRDVPEGEYAVHATAGVLWNLEGQTLTAAAQAATNRRERDRLGDRALEVLALVNGRNETTSGDVIAKVNGIDDKAARQYLLRLVDAGRIRRVRRGVYGPTTQPSEKYEESEEIPSQATISILRPSNPSEESAEDP